jgi:PAS domain S-box-containing protein
MMPRAILPYESNIRPALPHAQYCKLAGLYIDHFQAAGMKAQNPDSLAPQLATLLEHIPMGVLVIDADFRIAYVNPVAAPSFAAVRGSVIGRDFGEVSREVRDPEYAERVIKIFRHTIDTGETYFTSETAAPRGRPGGAFYEWRVERVPMGDGRYGAASFFRDISREVHQQELDRFRLALADALRPLKSPAEVQAAASKLLGERLRVTGVLYADVVSKEDSDYYILRQHYSEPGSPDLSGEYRANDYGQLLFDEIRAGHTLMVDDIPNEQRLSAEERDSYAAMNVRSHINVPLIKGGRHVAFVAVYDRAAREWTPLEAALVEEMADRTWAAAEQAKAEAAAREGEAKSARQRRLYEAILSNTPDFAYIFDLQHRFIYANEGLLKMYGKSWDDVIGKTFFEVGYEAWHAEMHEREIDQVVATKQAVRGDVPFAGTHGRRVYDYIFVPVFGPHGEVEAVAGTTRDVTDIKEADRRKDEFLATLAHELRNPLAPIRNAVHVLAMTAQDNKQTKQVCDMVERQVNHMVRLVDDLMEISRISRGIIELRREHTTLDSIVRSAVDTSTPLINGAKHKLVVALPEHPVMLYGDPVRLSQVIANLLNNAAKYTPRGGRIWLGAEQDGEELLIRVRDNGIGIAPAALKSVFEMFSQVKNPSSLTQGGLGIGLSLAKHLVEMHGGTITASSAGPGQGSEFRIRLPCLKAQRHVSEAEAPPAHAVPVRKRVLIVDDNEDAAFSLALLVRRLGADVQVANDGGTALGMIEQFQPELLLLDLGMPVMSGFEVAAQARKLRGMEKLKIVALTGWGQPEDRERTKAAGFDQHLVKPASLPELESLLVSG